MWLCYTEWNMGPINHSSYCLLESAVYMAEITYTLDRWATKKSINQNSLLKKMYHHFLLKFMLIVYAKMIDVDICCDYIWEKLSVYNYMDLFSSFPKFCSFTYCMQNRSGMRNDQTRSNLPVLTNPIIFTWCTRGMKYKEDVWDCG